MPIRRKTKNVNRRTKYHDDGKKESGTEALLDLTQHLKRASIRPPLQNQFVVLDDMDKPKQATPKLAQLGKSKTEDNKLAEMNLKLGRGVTFNNFDAFMNEYDNV